jgi:hypothetical protein
MARMSDILAVYAWVDPSTGYCQGLHISRSLILYYYLIILDVSKILSNYRYE